MINNNICIIIVNWNGAHFLEECLSSLEHQTYRDFVVLLVDNGSHDNSMTLVKSKFPFVHLIELPENLGFARSNNIGIKEAIKRFHPKYIALLNNDTRVDKEWLAALWSAAKRHPDASAIASLALQFDNPDYVDAAGATLLRSGLVYNRKRWQKRNEIVGGQYVFGPHAAAALYSIEVFEVLGGFDEDLHTCYEDVDLHWRMLHHGMSTWFEPTAVIWHKGSGTSRGKRKFQSYTYRNRILVNFVNVPMSFLLRYGLFVTAFELYMIFAVIVLGYGGIIFQVLSRIPTIIKKRRNHLQNSQLTNQILSGLIEHETWQNTLGIENPRLRNFPHSRREL